MSSEEKPRKDPEDKKEKPLTEEQLEQVSGGAGESLVKTASESKRKVNNE